MMVVALTCHNNICSSSVTFVSQIRNPQMKMRKRAPGGGRKPGGELRDLKAVMSLRMPQDLRDQLDRARQASGRSLSQELLARARLSFDRERERSRDRA